LYPAFVVGNVDKYSLAHPALGHDAAGNGHVMVFHRFKVVVDIR
jgi:hypothetical protein